MRAIAGRLDRIEQRVGPVEPPEYAFVGIVAEAGEPITVETSHTPRCRVAHVTLRVPPDTDPGRTVAALSAEQAAWWRRAYRRFLGISTLSLRPA